MATFSRLLALMAGSTLLTAAFAQNAPVQAPSGPARTVTLNESDSAYLVNALKAEPVVMTPRLESLIRRIRGDFANPNANFGVTTGYGLGSGQAFVGVSALFDADRRGRVNGTDGVDGSISGGFGLGDPVSSVGLEIDTSIMSTNPNDGTFGESGEVGVKLHKVFPHLNNLGIALGWADAGKWGAARNNKDTIYAAASVDLPVHLINGYPLQFTLGGGTGSFRGSNTVANKVKAFGSLGTQLTERTAISTSWSGNALNVGLGWVPCDAPVSIMLGVTDVTDRTKEGLAYNLSVGYSFNY